MSDKHVVEQRNQEATCFVGGLADEVDAEVLWELFTQAGPVVDVSLPKDPVSGEHKGFAFVEMRSVRDSEYACRVLSMVKLFGRPIRVDRSAAGKKAATVGAKLYVSGLSAEVDDKVLHDTFSAFGRIVGQAHVQMDQETGANKGFGFVEFDTFEAADAAVESLNGQYLCGRPLSVQYSYKRDTPNVRHGTASERLMAAAKQSAASGSASSGITFTAHTRFAATGPSASSAASSVSGSAGGADGAGPAAAQLVSGAASAAAAAAGASGITSQLHPPAAMPGMMAPHQYGGYHPPPGAGYGGAGGGGFAYGPRGPMMMPMMMAPPSGGGPPPGAPPHGMHGHAGGPPPPLPRVPRGFPVPHWAAKGPPTAGYGLPPPLPGQPHARPPMGMPAPPAALPQRPPPLPAAAPPPV